jgi:hypothetical protein|tara:strand:+ start:19311 stop:20141 length:831 start_codon:yes stop_codon:yes gene_type:complete
MIKDTMKDFFKFISERHQIYLNRQTGMSFPWTEDEILQTYSFCNVFRELDTVTIWLRENWREPYADHPNLPFAMAMARQINWTETLSEIGFPEEWNPEHAKNVMRARQLKKEKVYTGAYMLTGTLGGPKIDQTIDKILTPLYEDQPEIDNDSLENTWREYLRYKGFAKFISYEVVTDLRHTKHLNQAKDIMTWANAGPGAKRGLNRIFERDIKTPLKNEQSNHEMMDLLDISVEMLEPHVPALEMRDIEHSLCEFDKYERTRLNQGRPRAKYHRPV